MHEEKYSLTWQTYSDHLRSMMKELMMNEDFSDITLVTEDKKQIKANINILSICSPVFKDILKKEKNSNQIMYLRGVQYSEMESIMQFIYLGEATFYEERMEEFLAVAKSLEIKELCLDGNETNDEPEDKPSPSDQVPSSTEKLIEQIEISDQSTENNPLCREEGFVSNNYKYECEQCHKLFARQTSLTQHIQSNHEGVRYACNQCANQFTHMRSLRKHIRSKHEGVKYECDQCDYQASFKSTLTIHIQSKHEGVKYACAQCDYQASLKGSLTSHIQSKHEGVEYSCAECVYQATQQSALTRHIKSKHNGVKYACDKCDQQFSQQGALNRHKKNKHTFV